MFTLSDSDSDFLGGEDSTDERNVQTEMDDNDSIRDTVKTGDHHALGIIDRLARTLKTILTKLFLEEGTTNWINELDKIVDNYNNTPTDALDDHTPNEALNNTEIKIEVLHLNMDKSKKNVNVLSVATEVS